MSIQPTSLQATDTISTLALGDGYYVALVTRAEPHNGLMSIVSKVYFGYPDGQVANRQVSTILEGPTLPYPHITEVLPIIQHGPNNTVIVNYAETYQPDPQHPDQTVPNTTATFS